METKKRTKKKKRQPSFTLPKNPYSHQYGGSRSASQTKRPLIGTWTRLRSPGKRGQVHRGHGGQGQRTNGFLKLNEKVSQNLDVEEIGSWMDKQKELYARHKRPPAIPKRSPETKITTTDIQIGEAGQVEGGGAVPVYEDDEHAPESGYITPEQQSSELEYPVTSQVIVQPGVQTLSAGSVSSNQSTPRHSVQPSTTYVQAEVHVSCTPDQRISVASIGSVPSIPPPPPPQDAMALQINPLHGASPKHISMLSASTRASSGSSSGTLHDPYQPDDLYQHYLPGDDIPDSRTQKSSLVPAWNNEDVYESTLPVATGQAVPNTNNFSNRPLPPPPGGQHQRNVTNSPGHNSMPPGGAVTTVDHSRMTSTNLPWSALDEFPPPPPQFAGDPLSASVPGQQTWANTAQVKNSLPFPVRLRPTGSALVEQGRDNGDVLNIVVPPPSKQTKGAPPPVKPKSVFGRASSPDGAFGVPQLPSSQAQDSENDYSRIIAETIPPPPPPPEGLSPELVSRIQEWSLTNQERTLRHGLDQGADAHTALLNQIQTGIKLRKSPFSNRLFESPHRDDIAPAQHSVVTSPNTDYTYTDSIETCSTISGDSSSSGCHSSSSHINSTTSSPPPQTLPKPGARTKLHFDVTQLPGYQPIPSNCPAWKASLIERKNEQILDEARRKLLAQREEQDRWKDIPEWKKNLILEKEKRKMEEEASLEAERRRQLEEMARLQAMPEWKRDLILKKRGDQ